MEATNADMPRAGDAELILRTTQRQSAVMMVVCSRIRYGLLAASQADSWLLSLEQRQTAGAAGAAFLDTSGCVVTVAAVIGLPVAPSRTPLARCRWLRPRHLAREAPRLRLVETVLPVSRRRFASVRSSRCSTSLQSMKRQPAVRCCGLSAFCAAVCKNESSSCRNTAVLESRLTCSKLDSTSKKNSAKCLATSWRIEFLKARMYAQYSS